MVLLPEVRPELDAGRRAKRLAAGRPGGDEDVSGVQEEIMIELTNVEVAVLAALAVACGLVFGVTLGGVLVRWLDGRELRELVAEMYEWTRYKNTRWARRAAKVLGRKEEP